MEEILITSGRSNYHVDPVLGAWEWQIPLYLFLGGLAAGILFFSAFYFIRGKADDYKIAVKKAPIFTPIFISIGLVALLLDLTHKLYFWQLYTNISLESPMSWGAWTLGIVFPLSVIWPAFFIKEVYPNFKWPVAGELIDKVLDMLRPYQKQIAWVIAVTSVILGVYTGILLSAFNARPIWNTSILGPFFLVSGLSTGVAFILMLSKDKKEIHKFGRIDVLLISIEITLVVHMIMGYLSSTAQQIYWSHLFLGGEFTFVFWIVFFSIGLVVPLVLEILELKGKPINVKFPAALVLIGGLFLRFIMVEAGQISTWLTY
jgi:formate-dependent nitrite reductase membrane component NrfD